MAADLPQFRNGAEDLDPASSRAFFLQNLVDLRAQAFQRRPVDLFLFRCHPRRQGGLHLVRQFLQHVLLQAPDQERMDLFQQVIRVFPVLVLPQEGVVARQVSGQHKVKQAPQFAHAILHGRSGQGKTGIRLQLLHRLGRHAAGVLDILCLVQNDKTELMILQQADIPADQRITGDHHIHVPVADDMPDQSRPLGAVAAEHGHAQIRREFPEFAQPVISQGRGRHHQAGPSSFPGGDQQGNDLCRLAQSHIIRQDPAHMHPVQGDHPLISALLVIPQAHAGSHLRRVGFPAAGGQAFRKLPDLFVQFNFDPAVFQHACQVSGPVRPQHDGIPVQFISVPYRGLIDSRRGFLPSRQVFQIQELAAAQAEIPPFPAQGFHQLQDLINRFPVPGQHQLNPVAVHPHAAGHNGPPGHNALELPAQEHIRRFLQPLDALSDKVKHSVCAAQADVVLSDAESCIRQDIQHPVLTLRVPKQQLFSLIQGDLLFIRPEGIQGDIAITEQDGGYNALAVPVQVYFCFQRQADQPLPQGFADLHRPADLQVRQDLADDPFRIAEGIFHQAAAFILVFIDQPDQADLFPFRPDQAAARNDPGTGRCYRLQVRRNPPAHLQAPGSQVNREVQGHLRAADRFPVLDLSALVHHPQGCLPDGFQQLLRKGFRQAHEPVGRRIAGGGPGFPGGTQLPQQIQHPHIVIGIAHPFRLVNKILSQFDGFPCLQGCEEMPDILDHIELLFTGPQADPQFLSRLLGQHKGHFQADVRLRRHFPQDHIGKLRGGFRRLLLHHALRHLPAVRVQPDRHRVPAAAFMQEDVTVAVDHQAPCQRHGMRRLTRHRIADHSPVFLSRLHRADLFQVPSRGVFLFPGQFFHQQRIQSHALFPAHKNIEPIIILPHSCFFLLRNCFVNP